MKLRYNSNNQLNLSQLIDNYEIPYIYKMRAVLTHMYDHVYSVISDNYNDSVSAKKNYVKQINTLTYFLFKQDNMPLGWNRESPFLKLPDLDEDELSKVLGEYYLEPTSIVWDVPSYLPLQTVERINQAVETVAKAREAEKQNIKENHSVRVSSTNRLLKSTEPQPAIVSQPELKVQSRDNVDMQSANKLTSMDDILLDPGFPYFPRVDFNNYWIIVKDTDGEEYGIPRSLPIIPECQSDITATTEFNKMVNSDFMKLYPNHIMKLRSSAMYQKYEGYDCLEYDDDLGIIFPIKGFTREQVVDSIIKYPDIINIGLGRLGKKKKYPNDSNPDTIWEELHTRIEIDGELLLVTRTLWENTEELNKLPPNKAFQQEYIVRKYLLEKDNNIHHEKEAFGETYPFITLFMRPEDYIKRGYSDVLDIAKQCVKSRVFYYRSRNAMLRRLGIKFNYEGEMISK